MELKTISLRRDEAVASITFERPEVRNAFDDQTIIELTAAIRALGDDAAVRVIVLGARGPAFCAGGDLNWMQRIAAYSEEENRADALALATMVRTIYECPKPVVARIQGDVYGGGVGVVAACDIAISVDTAGFCLSEARLGLTPATIAPYVIRAIGERAAHRYFMTAERFDAAEALRIGLVHQVVGANGARGGGDAASAAGNALQALDEAVTRITQAIVGNGPMAVSGCKRLVADLADAPINDATMLDSAERLAQARASAEGSEGLRSFLEKRRPNWAPSTAGK
ncbi:MAG: enoyl-CoA hydratase/isomerase family protein [Janthinobacterium lividum]